MSNKNRPCLRAAVVGGLMVTIAAVAVAAPPVLGVADLRADPMAYDGHVVTLVGYFSMEHENDNVWASETAAFSDDRQSCVTLRNVPRNPRLKARLNGGWGTITGLFTAKGPLVNGKRVFVLGGCSDSVIEFRNDSDLQPIGRE